MKYLMAIPYLGIYAIVGFVWMGIVVLILYGLWVAIVKIYVEASPRINWNPYRIASLLFCLIAWTLAIGIGHRLIGGWFHL